MSTLDSLYIRHVNSNLGNSATLKVTTPHSLFLGGFVGSILSLGQSKKSMLSVDLSRLSSNVKVESEFAQKIESEMELWTLNAGVQTQILPTKAKSKPSQKISGSLKFQGLAGLSLLQHSFSLADPPNKNGLSYKSSLWQLQVQSGLWQDIQISHWFTVFLSATAQFAFPVYSSVSIENFTANGQDVRYKSDQLKIREKLTSNQFGFPLRLGFRTEF
jgi:hypothetical protein